MAMHNRGLTKLVEECGELTQIAAKKMAYADVDIHPDGRSMKLRMEDEIADVIAACAYVSGEFKLNQAAIDLRVQEKILLFYKWKLEP